MVFQGRWSLRTGLTNTEESRYFKVVSVNRSISQRHVSPYNLDAMVLYILNFYNISVSPCSPNPCLNDGSCTVDIYSEAVCTCNGEWTGCDCSSKYKHGM